MEIGSFEAKTHLSELLQKVERGESFVITRRGKPVAELGPVPQGKKKLPRLGWAKGTFKMMPGFDDPLEDFKDYM